MNSTGNTYKTSGWALVGLSAVSLPIALHSLFNGFMFELAPIFLLLAVIPALVGRWFIRLGRKNEQGNTISKNEKIALQVAQQSGGKITATDLAANTNMNIAESQKFLEKMHESDLVEIYQAENGVVLYKFPEILTDKERGESQKLM